MNTLPRKYLRVLAASVLLSLFCVSASRASHLIGDEFTCKYLGDSTSGSWTFQKYQVTLSIYIDCLAGNPMAIAQDDPAFFGLFDSSGTLIEMDTNVYSSSFVSVPGTSSGPCGTGSAPALCIMKRTFIKEYDLPASGRGYTIAYQRCCKNAGVTNIIDPADSGSTYFCTIPSSGIVPHNNSAVFTYEPPEVVAIGAPFAFYSSATDADGDSLSYELCPAYSGANDPDYSKPYPVAPPYSPVGYVPSLSYSNPMSCSVPLAVNPVTGILTGTPNLAGRYLIAICCHEWRGGLMINTVHREFELAVGDFASSAYHPYAGEDTAIMVGDSVQFHASGAVTYLWTPGTYLTDTSIYDPIGHFPVAGTFTYVLHGVSDSGCSGTDTITVLVLAHSEYRVANAFTPNGDGINDVLIPVPLENSQLVSFKVFSPDGRLLYTGTQQGDGWDGTSKGAKLPTGVYLWQVLYQDNTGQTREMSGNVTLLR